MEAKFHCANEEAMKCVAASLAELVPGSRVFALYGDLGAGKTTLVRMLCDGLGIKGPVSSPTFSIINEYAAADGSPVYHIDLYRLKSLKEIYDLGIEEYLYDRGLCFIEWPDMAAELLPPDYVRIDISMAGEGRNVTIRREQ